LLRPHLGKNARKRLSPEIENLNQVRIAADPALGDSLVHGIRSYEVELRCTTGANVAYRAMRSFILVAATTSDEPICLRRLLFYEAITWIARVRPIRLWLSARGTKCQSLDIFESLRHLSIYLFIG
jgi:hypothetical protein